MWYEPGCWGLTQRRKLYNSFLMEHLWFAERLKWRRRPQKEWISSGFSVINTMCGGSDRPSFTTLRQEPKIANAVHIWTANESSAVMSI